MLTMLVRYSASTVYSMIPLYQFSEICNIPSISVSSII